MRIYSTDNIYLINRLSDAWNDLGYNVDVVIMATKPVLCLFLVYLDFSQLIELLKCGISSN